MTHGHEDDLLADGWEDDASPRIMFSMTEVLHLTASVVVLTLAFGLILGGRRGGAFDLSADVFDVPTLISILPYAALAVIPAFILHELAHKVAAQRKDMWAEFRANFKGLAGGLLLTAFTGFLFAVPGAVHIVGRATRRDTGIISIVGPLVNLALGYGAYMLETFRIVDPIPVAEFGSFLELILLLNAILAGFNMLPIGPLDGRKVWRWSPLGFFGMWALIVALPLLYYTS